MLATLFLSQGVPMLLAGDELANTQDGNNNAYCQDNPLSWLDWSRSNKWQDHLEFVKKLIVLRKKYPALRRTHYLHGNDKSRSVGLPDISWLNRESSPMSDKDWHNEENRFVAILLCGDAGNDSISEINAACTVHKTSNTTIHSQAHAADIEQKSSKDPMVESTSMEAPVDTSTRSVKADGIVMIIINGFEEKQKFNLPDLKRTWFLEMTTEDPLRTRSELSRDFQCPPMSVSLCALD